jgi:putative aminopeptidase FrvX
MSRHESSVKHHRLEGGRITAQHWAMSTRPFVLLAALPITLAAQSDAAARALASWTAVLAPPGHETTSAALLARSLRGWTMDAQGNLVKRVGSGSPRRVVACAMDVSAFVVSQITSNGYVRLRRSGGTGGHQLWDQFHEAQRVAIMTARGPRAGVVAAPNGHFTQQHRGDTLAVTADNLWVDVGATSRADAEAHGIAMLDPVVIDRPAWTFESYVAGPAAGARAGCAAVATAANGRVTSGETMFVISNQRIFGWRGLATVMARHGQVASLTLVDEGQRSTTGAVASASQLAQRHSALARTARVDSVRVLAPRVRWQRTMVETIHADDARALLDAVAGAAGVALDGTPWVAIGGDTARVLPARGNSLDEIERQWLTLIDLPGVAGHEHLVRDAVLAGLPEWARRIAVVDSAGNVIVAMGPDRDSVAFIAHMDEVGFEVTGILPDGRVTMRTRGGVVVPSWEGVPAILSFDPTTAGAMGAVTPAPIRGVFVPRDSGRLRSPGQLTAWFGLDSLQLSLRGVRVASTNQLGSSVTAYKRAARLAGTRITGRASDDRSGSTALLWAIRRIRPDSLRSKVIFVWSVQEEGGLNGARAFGDRHGTSLKRVHSIDTFVSSDTPLESPHFAFAPLGNGAVLRALDNSSIVPREDRERIIRIAREQRIPLQVGTTFGGTDGSAIQMWGPNNIGLSWPGRYSHGPAEVLDLKDLEALARLIVAVAASR